jgi:sigma-B regulation protein RsbU (phosphoserine phosphatase)
MMNALRNLEAAVLGRVWKQPPTGWLVSASVRCALITLASMALGIVLPGGLGSIFRLLSMIAGGVLVLCLLGLLLRWVFSRVLWTVRSRLIVTCILMGLAPIALLGTLAGVAGYIFLGQFATSVAFEGISDGLARAHDQSEAAISELVNARPGEDPPQLSPMDENRDELFVTYWRDGHRLAPSHPRAQPAGLTSPFFNETPPEWLHPGFKSVVTIGEKFYLCAGSGSDAAGHTLYALVCSAFDKPEMATLAEGLGLIRITGRLRLGVGPDHRDPRDPKDFDPDSDPMDASHSFTSLQGGTLAAPINPFDLRVYFSAPLPTTAWQAGKPESAWLIVVSRPAVLYRRLFANSLKAGVYIHAVLIGTAVLFGVLELLAFLMAIALSRTITQSIGDLYDATREIDRGNLDHQIPVRRRDQLAALAGSFNTMTTSLKGLLEDQREKDRMQNELNIAQEVQRNLFPHAEIVLPGFEIFGVCEPARTIGGDYYDFIPFGASQMYLALGDISGKGISAALLMASLHSAVRAYYGGNPSNRDCADDALLSDESMSPGRLLALLNRHLYTSTQAEKYATLFVASYDSITQRLTYSNGGHLAPILVRSDGKVSRLDCGGSVVGLLDGLVYQEATVQLNRGDLLIAYSDGLTEPERELREFGEERLLAAIRRHQILPLCDIAAHSLAAVREWIGEEEQPDDMTLVLARIS